MKPEIKEIWCEALESGEFKQANQALYDECNNSYCCLGVLRMVCAKNGIDLPQDAGGDEYLEMEPCEEKTGLTFSAQKDLWLMNDKGVPFSEIAAHIRKSY